MRLDKLTQFSSAQAVTSSASSTNVIDLTGGNTANYQLPLFGGQNFYCIIQVTTALAATSIRFDLNISDSSTDMSSTPITLATYTVTTSAAINTLLAIPIPNAIPWGSKKRYMGMYYTVNTGSTGAVSVWLAVDRPENAVFIG